jgi:hypothetical protein
MSRSNPRLENPAARIFEWSSDNKCLVWYNRETRQNVRQELPFEFLVLDQVCRVGGFNEAANRSYWSNELRVEDLKTVPFDIRLQGTIVESKPWKQVTLNDAKFVMAIYMAFIMPETGEWTIGCFRAQGAACGAWMDFKKTCNVENGKIRVTGSHEEVKGRNAYNAPDYEWLHSDTSEDNIAGDLDVQLQRYFSAYFGMQRNMRGQKTPEVEDAGITSTELRQDLAEPMSDAELLSLMDQGGADDINPDDLPVHIRS